MEFQSFAFETVRPLRPSSGARPFEPGFGRQIEDERQVGSVRSDHDPFQLSDEAGGELARHALIGAGGIGETVADDPFAPLERRNDRFIQMVDAGGGEQERFSVGPEPGGKAAEDRLPQFFPPAASRPALACARF